MKYTTGRILIFFIIIPLLAGCQDKKPVLADYRQIVCGADLTGQYLPLIKSKKVGIVTNPSSLVGKTHLVDSLLTLNVNIINIFSPEHGFRGDAEAGEQIENGFDGKTGIRVISLYGNHKKPSAADLKNIDIMIFDLQDVGVRFYTYISTLTYVMEACAEQNIPLIVLDRPNPNGFYVDGPVLKPGFSSFVGLHPVPLVYGMTIGEYALMVNGEGWLTNGLHCNLKVIKLKGYTHNMIVKLPVKPSPNLPNWESVYLYPSLALFEGTIVSVGRGTDTPFQIYGHPDFLLHSFSFTPHSIRGVSNHPKYEGKTCYGQNLNGYARNYQENPLKINLSWLISTYKMLSPKYSFFNNYFEKLAGTDQLKKQIEAGMSEEKIRESWQVDLSIFRKVRAQYLLYP